MGWVWSTLVALVAATVVGGVVAGILALTQPFVVEPEVPPAGDRVRAAAADLREGRVHVDPRSTRLLEGTSEAELEQILADTEVPVRLVVWVESRQAGYDGAFTALDQLRAEVGEDGVYVLWQGTSTDNLVTTYGARRPDVYSVDLAGDLAPRMRDLAAVADDSDGIRMRTDDWGGPGGGALLGLLAGSLVALVAIPLWLAVRGLLGLGLPPRRMR